ncbi:MAG: phosphoglucosamine mutase [Chlamydiales bacterium]
MNEKKLFGTDGVRGHANRHPTTAEIALFLGKAVAKVLSSHGKKQRVVLGKDTRLSGYMFENALIAGLTSMGVDTLMVGPLPTPGVAYITRAYRADAGIMISASHNAFCDNGIKIFGSEGFKIPDAVEREIEELVFARSFEAPEDSGLGRNKRIDDADGRYIEFVKATFLKGRTLEGMRIFLDCAHGAAHRVAPSVFWELDGQVEVVGNHPNGTNINAGFGSLHPQVIQKGVLEYNSAVGIAFDGDADRVVMADENGILIDGDVIVAICAQAMKERGELKNNRVVATVMTNLGVVKFLESLGIEVLLSQVGDRHVLEMMLVNDAFLGGEQSGHMLFLDHNTTGDGIVSALQVLRIMIEKKTSLAELAKPIKKYPQKLINIKVRSKPPLEQMERVQKIMGDVERTLRDEGRILVRYSGTEQLCRVLVEGKRQDLVDSCAEQIAQVIESEIGLCAASLVI